VIDAAQGATGLLVTYTPIHRQAMAALPDLQIVVRCGIGVDNVDLVAAGEHGIRVCNVPDYCWDEVADHTMALLLAAERKIDRQSNAVRGGRWDGIKGAMPIRGLQGRVLGIIGLGNIGRKVVPRARAFGLSVIAYDPYLKPEDARESGVIQVSLDELLAAADYISLHAPLTEKTYHIINAAALKKMKSTAYLINTSRGPLIDRLALLQALTDGHIAGAALDVVEDEPKGATDLAQLPNVIFTPHTAWYSERSFHQLQRRSAEEIARFLRGEPLRNPVV
jgi:D-3-phosphoglycerate dehydrogenase